MSNSQLRIVAVRYYYASGGGPEKLIHAMAKYLDRDTMSLTLILWLHPGSDCSFINAIKQTGITVECLRISRFNPWVIFRFLQLIRRYNAQVFHTHDFLSDIYGIVAAKIAGCFSVCSAHGFVQTSWKIRLYEFVDIKCMPFFDRVMAGSQAMKRFLIEKGIHSKRICLVNNAIDLEETKGCGKKCDFRKEYQIDPEEFIVGVVGRLSSEKGHKNFLNVVSQLDPDLPKTRFVIVGDGVEMGSLKKEVRDLGLSGRVLFTGYYHNVNCFLKQCDIFVLPSLRESLPLSLVEAMSFGIPVIATRVGSVPELVGPDESGLIVSPGDKIAMKNAIEKLLTDRKMSHNMGNNGKMKVEQEYSARSMVKKIAEIYKSTQPR
ncbi:MAG: glycosyltransferase [Desulfobacteraceae bacterium]|nr:glycosyltransferase [Desulfobacteraceae bacterium]